MPALGLDRRFLRALTTTSGIQGIKTQEFYDSDREELSRTWVGFSINGSDADKRQACWPTGFDCARSLRNPLTPPVTRWRGVSRSYRDHRAGAQHLHKTAR